MKHPLWSPTNEAIEKTNLYAYQQWLLDTWGLRFTNYFELWQWSVEHSDRFWKSLWAYFDILHDGSYHQVKSKKDMPGIRWFEGTSLNYAEHLFRNTCHQDIAIIYGKEHRHVEEITWGELYQSTASFQSFLTSLGIKIGDSVVAYTPCIPETTMAFLATSSLGAIWSSCSSDFGAQSVIDRFSQLKPKVLLATSTYYYGGKNVDSCDTLLKIVRGIPSIEQVVLIDKEEKSFPIPYVSWSDIIKKNTAHPLIFRRVPFNHPLWVLYSSGTTGLPKAITHSHGGMLLEQLKYLTFHQDIQPHERCFWYTSTGWMMWNHIQGSLLCGGIMVIYNGSPSYPTLNVLWQFAQDTKVSQFGTSAGFIMINRKRKIDPQENFDLTSLRALGSTGSILPPEGFTWVHDYVKKDIWVTSMSGGTDVCSAFVGGNPMLPVYEGEIQCRALGCSLYVWDQQGNDVHEAIGEMVVTQPMPSMPIYLWGDLDNEKYKKSYFDMYPNMWRHGDWVSITRRQGVVIYGRSDATLNRGGIRIGTSEIYRSIDYVKEVRDSLIICIEKKGGVFFMPLFVALNEGVTLSQELKKKINETIRTRCSPRHKPDSIYEVGDIPYTVSGKKIETPIKKIFMGYPPKEVINKDSLKNPDAIDFYVELYDTLLAKKKL